MNTSGVIAKLGGACTHAVEETGGGFIFLARILYWIFTPPFKIKEIFKQMNVIGVNSLPVVLTTGAFTGMVLAVQSYYQFNKLEMNTAVGIVVSLSMTRELGPVLTALMVAGRAGAGMTAEIGTMKVTEQIDALSVMAVDPINYLAVPRFISSVILVPVLTIYADFVGILGGYGISIYAMGINSTFYINNTLFYTRPEDVMSGLIKAVFFGAIIATIGCYKGFSTKGGAEGVGKSTTESVVTSFMLIIGVDLLLSFIFL